MKDKKPIKPHNRSQSHLIDGTVVLRICQVTMADCSSAFGPLLAAVWSNDLRTIVQLARNVNIDERSSYGENVRHCISRWILDVGVQAAELLQQNGLITPLIRSTMFGLLATRRPTVELQSVFRWFSARQPNEQDHQSPIVAIVQALECEGIEDSPHCLKWIEFAMEEGHPLVDKDASLDGFMAVALIGNVEFIERFANYVPVQKFMEAFEVAGAARLLGIDMTHRRTHKLEDDMANCLQLWRRTVVLRQIYETPTPQWKSSADALRGVEVFSSLDDLENLDGQAQLVQALAVLERSLGSPWTSSASEWMLTQMASRSSSIIESFVGSARDRLNLLTYMLTLGSDRSVYIRKCLDLLQHGGVGLLDECVQDVTANDVSNFAKVLFGCCAEPSHAARFTRTRLTLWTEDLSKVCDRISLPELSKATLSSGDLNALLQLAIISWAAHLYTSKDISFYQKLIFLLFRKGASVARPTWKSTQMTLLMIVEEDMEPIAAAIQTNTPNDTDPEKRP